MVPWIYVEHVIGMAGIFWVEPQDPALPLPKNLGFAVTWSKSSLGNHVYNHVYIRPP